MTDAFIVDIDECFCKTEFIFDEILQKGIKAPDKWAYFHANVHRCVINDWCLHLVKRFRLLHKLIFVTARSEEIRGVTENMLKKALGDDDFILEMRPLDDYGKSAQVKANKLQKLQKDYNIVLAIDDDISNCKMFQSFGIPTLKVM